ncbi:Chromodomain-helicase-DNA-binding protein 1-like [Irineochytrium annulatum]|nr:Chromodomain-helicase-DNA-binding protein 1-like [Irineochytrium annulatum]
MKKGRRKDDDYVDDQGADANSADQNPALIDASRAAFSARLRSKAPRDPFDSPRAQPPGLVAGVKLRDYQLQGVQWMNSLYSHGLGGILADEMGLGKTLQAITFLIHLKSLSKHHGAVLVVVPLSVFKNWSEEFERFAGPALSVFGYIGTKDERAQLRKDLTEEIARNKDKLDVFLTTFETAYSDADFIKTLRWKYLIVDEAHRLKNSKSALHTSLFALKVPHTLLLTGTPIQNNLKELGALLRFACRTVFVDEGDGGLATWFEPAGSTPDERKDLMHELQELIRPFLLRREKKDVLVLPEMKESILYAPLTALQKKLYKSILTKDLGAFDLILMQLRKCCNHPYMFDGIEPEPFEAGAHLIEASGKLVLIDRLLTHLKRGGHRVLVGFLSLPLDINRVLQMFSQMTFMLDILQDYLAYKGWSYERLDGSVRGEERFLAVRNFNGGDDADEERAFVFLLSTRAGGVGLNLTSADTVIFVDSDFNPTMDQQAAARAHRIGQMKKVRIFRLLTEGSVEEVIYRRAKAKLLLGAEVMSGGSRHAGATSSTPPAKSEEIISILRFGLDRIIDEKADEPVYPTDEALAKLIDGVDDGAAMDVDEEDEEVKADNMYVYEGKDYKADEKAFGKLRREVESLREQVVTGAAFISKTRNLDEAALARREEERQRARHRREELRKKREEKKHRRWKEVGYISLAIGEEDHDKQLEEKEEDEDEEAGYISLDEDEDDSGKWTLRTGDVSAPVVEGKLGIIVHVVDDSGSWPDRGVFAALNDLEPSLQQYYASASENDDLALGSAHLVKVEPEADDGSNTEKAELMVAIVVAQKRSATSGAPSGLKFPELEAGLKKVARVAKFLKASVHLPRIGQSTPGFDWYKTERIIRKCLPARGVDTTLYYYKRRHLIKPPASKGKGTVVERDLKRPRLDSTNQDDDDAMTIADEAEGDGDEKMKVPGRHGPFSGEVVLFVGAAKKDLKRLNRIVEGGGGNVATTFDDDVTVIVVGPDEEAVNEWYEANSPGEIRIENVEWVEEKA